MANKFTKPKWTVEHTPLWPVNRGIWSDPSGVQTAHFWAKNGCPPMVGIIPILLYIYNIYIYIYVINPHEISTMVISHHSIPAVHFLHLLLSPIPNFRSGFFLESPSHHGCLIFPILVIVLSDYPINIPFISPEKIPGSWDFGQYIPFIFHS